MTTSHETVSNDKAKRRKRIRISLAGLGLGFCILLLIIWSTVTQPVFGTIQVNQSLPKVQPARLEAHVRMVSEGLGPRDETHPANLDRVAGYIRQEFIQAKGIVSDQPFEAGGKTYRNVIALFGPDTKERIVVGAHYDACEALPGADDNASGVAGLIELGYLLGKAQLPMRVELVAYTLEEPPYFRTKLMGSAIHAASLKKAGIPIRVMFSLEMIGYFSDTPDSQHYPLAVLKGVYPSQGNFISVVGRLGEGNLVRKIKEAMLTGSELPVYSINAPATIEGLDFSDHLNYWEAGYSAVMVSDTAFFRNDRYHTARDTADTLDYRRMAMVVQDVYAAVLAISR